MYEKFVKTGETYEISARRGGKRGRKPAITRAARYNPRTMSVEFIQATGGVYADYNITETQYPSRRAAVKAAISFIKDIIHF